MAVDPDPVSSYLAYLPAVLRQSPFLGRFLLAFEAMLSGVDASLLPPIARPGPAGLERVLEGIDRFYIPRGVEEPAPGEKASPLPGPPETDEEFLPWLAQWVAVSLRDDWGEATRRNFLSNIVPLYRERGTRAGIQKVLELSGLSNTEVLVVDFFDGEHASEEAKYFPVTPVTPRPAFFFGVILTVTTRDAAELARLIRQVRAIVDQEKPAHTFYGLHICYPALRINDAPATNPSTWGPGITLSDSEPLVLGTTSEEDTSTRDLDRRISIRGDRHGR